VTVSPSSSSNAGEKRSLTAWKVQWWQERDREEKLRRKSHNQSSVSRERRGGADGDDDGNDDRRGQDRRPDDDDDDGKKQASSINAHSSSSSERASPSSLRRLPQTQDESKQYVLTEARQYTGHLNVRTVKEVNFYGPRSDHVISGSDDGNIFIWRKSDGKLVQLLEGDDDVVNVVQSSPDGSCLATSGIERTVKIWRAVSDYHNPLEDAEVVMQRNMRSLENGNRFHTNYLLELLLARFRGAQHDEDDEDDEDDNDIIDFTDS